MKRGTLMLSAALVVLGAFSDTVIDHNVARAVVGRPATPVSYAGVARRSARRTTAVVATTPVVSAGAVTALPAGCALATGVYTCGAVRYRPYYQGSTVVYRPI